MDKWNLSDWLTLVGFLLTVEITIIGSVWWLSSQFSNVRALVYSNVKEVYDKVEHGMDKLLEKLEYHERHDDRRFAEIRDDLWSIKVRNAQKDGLLMRNNFDQKEDNSERNRRPEGTS